jgi:3-deoxy-D-manno-octulosonate 8-phosphate phosphatase (KDO 8-P phosphatase)
VEKQLTEKLKKVKILIIDIDGVLTDGSIYIDSEGKELKRFSALDGIGLSLLKAAGMPLAVISGRRSNATKHRLKELGFEDNIYQGNVAKIGPYNEIKSRFGIADEEIVYIGDDLSDIPILEKVGVPVTVANAPSEVREVAAYVTDKVGGDGAVREVVELILKAQGKFTKALSLVTNVNK